MHMRSSVTVYGTFFARQSVRVQNSQPKKMLTLRRRLNYFVKEYLILDHIGIDHVLGYWRGSLESPKNVLFLKYEHLKNKIMFYVKRMVQFMSCPFFLEEEDKGMVQKIIDLCSFENLSKLEVNRSGQLHPYLI